MPLGPLPDIKEWEKSFKGALKGDRPAFPDCSAGPSPGLIAKAREKAEAVEAQKAATLRSAEAATEATG